MIKHGVKRNKPDHRDFSYHRTFGAVGSVVLAQVADDFDFDAGLSMPDQNRDGLYQGCTGYAQADICGDEDKDVYNPRFIYDQSLIIEGVKPGDSQFEEVPVTIRSSLKTVTKIGVIKVGETNDKAYARRRDSYFDALDNNSFFDAFDGLRVAMWNAKKPTTVGTPWFMEWENPQNGIISNTFTYDGNPDHYSWHNYKISGFKKINGVIYARVKSWQGSIYGDQGWAYFPREVINKILSIDGSFAYIILPKDKIPGEIQTVQLSFWVELVSKLVVFFTSLIKKPMPIEAPPLPPVPEPAPIETVMETPMEVSKYDFDTPELARHSCRVIMDEMGLTGVVDPPTGYPVKDVLCAVISAESGFNPKAKNENKDKEGNVLSTDWGLLQINDFYHVGPSKEFSSVEEVLNNPEKSVRFLIKMYQKGKLNLWVAYSSGRYKKYL